jgi:hypothetical protein
MLVARVSQYGHVQHIEVESLSTFHTKLWAKKKRQVVVVIIYHNKEDVATCVNGERDGDFMVLALASALTYYTRHNENTADADPWCS